MSGVITILSLKENPLKQTSKFGRLNEAYANHVKARPNLDVCHAEWDLAGLL